MFSSEQSPQTHGQSGGRGITVVMIVLLLAMVIMVAWSILGAGSALSTGAGLWTILLGALILAAALISLVVAGSAPRPPAPSPSAGSPGRSGRVLRIVYPGALLLVVVSMAITDVPASLPGTIQAGLRAVTWAVVGCSVALVALPGLHRSRPRRMSLLALSIGWPSAYAVILSVLVSPRLGVQALSWPMALLSIAGLVTVPTLLIWGAVEGLPGSENRALRLWRLVQRRPWLVLTPLLLDIALVIVVLIVASRSGAADPPIPSGAVWWVFAFVVAVGLLAILALDRRIVVDARDQATFGRIVTAMTGVPLALTMVVFFGLPVWRVRTLSDGATLLLLAVALIIAILARLERPRVAPQVVIGAGALLGAGTSLGALLTARSGPHAPVGTGSVAMLQLVFGLGLIMVLLGTVVAAVVSRRPKLLILMLALVVWTGLAVVTGSWGSGPTIVPLTLAVIVLLGGAGLLWLFGRQQLVDGYEVVITGLIAAPLWLVPAMIRLAPDPWPRWILIATFLGPGVVIAAREVLSLLRRWRRPAELGTLSVTTLTYAMIAALAWYTGDKAAALADDIASFLLDVFLLPLSVLLILGASARRRAAWSAPDPATVWSPDR